MDVTSALERCGGFANRRTLVRMTSRRRLERALRSGEVVRRAHGRYALVAVDAASAAAYSVGGVLSHRSAAAWWGWEQKEVPLRPEVTVPKHRRPVARDVALHWADLHPSEVTDVATNVERTLVDCARHLPFDEALAIADSALRSGHITHDGLTALAASVRGPGAPRVRQVARHADPRAANPFESVLRALAIEEGLDVVPQVWIPEISGRPDLVDESRSLVLEADSFEWHGRRAALRRDCRRYTSLVALGWRVLRFAWEDVMHDQVWVRAVLRAAAGPDPRTQVRARRPRAA